MELSEAVVKRRSIRSFTDKKVPDDLIKKIINNAQYAPSACNLQLWKFIVVNEDLLKEKLVKLAGSTPLVLKAPHLVVVTYKKSNSTEDKQGIMSAAAAIQNMLLSAHSFGLGCCWFGKIGDEHKVKSILNIPDNYMVISFVAVGYPAFRPKAPKRRDVDEIMSINTFNGQTVQKAEISSSQVLKDLIDHRDKMLRHTEPFPDSFPYGVKSEFLAEIKLLKIMLRNSRTVLELLPYAGTHTVELLKVLDVDQYSVFEISKESEGFIRERLRRAGINQALNYVFKSEPVIDIGDKFDAVLCLQKLENFPEILFIPDLKKLVKPNGCLIISFRNKNSFLALSVLHKKIFNSATYEALPIWPLDFKQLEKKLLENGFKIDETYGISPLPFMRGTVVKGYLSRLCKLIIVKASLIKSKI